MAVPFPKSATSPEPATRSIQATSESWISYAAAGSLLIGGALLLTGRRRAGMVAAAAGAALTCVDQQDVVRAWWAAVPVYLDEAQRLIAQAQRTVDELSAQRDRLHHILAR